MQTSLRNWAGAAFAVAAIAGCGGGGDIELNPTTVDNSVSNTGSNDDANGNADVCASYTTASGQTRQGDFDGTHCRYGPTFVDAGNSLETDLTIPALPDDGAHIFEGSMFVGRAYDSDAELADAGIAQGGDGPTLTIEAGATLAWESNDKFMVVNRGSRLMAVGTAAEPITFTSVSDVNGDLADRPEAVSQWGGIVINGFGVTNKCAYTGVRGDDLTLSGECHVASEGSAGLDENYYGGDNDDDSSGRLEYVVVKHTGAEVGNGDELNGITFGAVGRNTVVRNLETYATYDDGIEMFGGAVSFENYAGVYVRDDSIDIDEGWIGAIDTGLVVQSETDGNHCIEADGIGAYDDLDPAVVDDFIDRGLNSQPTISKLTCIVSANGADTATHDPGAGWRFREGIAPVVNDSLVIASFGPDAAADANYCLRIDNRSRELAQSGDVILAPVVMACEDRTNGGSLPDGTSVEDWAAAQGVTFATVAGAVDPTPLSDTGLQLLEDVPPLFSLSFESMVVDDAGLDGAPRAGSFIGALSRSEDNPFASWTFGIFEDNRSVPLWIEAQR
ncbi:MAG: serine/threonine protein kinase [Pseudomonadota bacterium]